MVANLGYDSKCCIRFRLVYRKRLHIRGEKMPCQCLIDRLRLRRGTECLGKWNVIDRRREVLVYHVPLLVVLRELVSHCIVRL